MRKFTIFCLLVILTLIFFFPLNLNGANIAKVNLGLAISLHPEMSLFDFDRMGFFKVKPGLSNKEFQARVQDLKQAADTSKVEAKIKNLQNQLMEIDEQKARILNNPISDANNETEQIKEIRKLNDKTENILKKIDDLNYQISCSDLTSPTETRKRLNKIEKETLATLRQIAKEKKYQIVLNNSITVPFNYPLKYESGEQYGLGVPGIDYSLFYSFLANREHLLPSDETPESRKIINWLELAQSPRALEMLPLKPYPLVLSGGVDLTSELVTRIYQKYKIDEKVTNTVKSILDLIEQHNQNYDTEIDKIIAPD